MRAYYLFLFILFTVVIRVRLDGNELRAAATTKIIYKKIVRKLLSYRVSSAAKST